MALIKDNYDDTKHGMVIPSAYIRIVSFEGDKAMVRFVVAVYADKQARTDEKQPIEINTYEIPYQDGMDLNSIYTYLKTLPELDGSVDDL